MTATATWKQQEFGMRRQAGKWSLVLCLFTLGALLPASVRAQTFQSVPALSFTKAYAGGDPLPQVISIASTGATFNFSAAPTTTTGGGWLHLSVGTVCCYAAPNAITVSANPDVTLAAGTYSGVITVKSQYGSITMTIPVTLIIKAASSSFFDQISGGMTFSMIAKGAPPTQALQIRNSGTGTLAWTASTSTADHGNWLTMSSLSGTAPAFVSVGITPANLPGNGLVVGTFVGQIVFQTSGDVVTVPVIVTVGDSVFQQISPLNFTKLYQGGDPLAQVISIASTGTNFNFSAVAVNSTGGNWLNLNIGTGCCSTTPTSITVSATPDINLAAGTYAAEIVLGAQYGGEGMVIPVTFTVEPTTATFFDALPGELTFSMATSGNTPPGQTIPIRNAGTGTLNWTLGASTADGGSWITVSATSGPAPSSLTVAIKPASLPGEGLVAGTFTGQVVLQTGINRVTVPVTVTVGASVFRQINPLTLTKTYQGADPLPQVISVASTGTNFNFSAVVVNSTGGNWLNLSVGTGCCYATPTSITVSANPGITLAQGTYSAEIIIKAQYGGGALVVPVTLTIQSTTSPFFDALPGELTFSMATHGSAPPTQPIQIRNAGSGTLAWTASTSTADGGSWLIPSAISGTAPSVLSVSINPKNLPNQSLAAGTFTGQVVLHTGGNVVTIPVTVTVGDSVFSQINALNFNKTYEGADPLPQVITIGSTATNFNFSVVAVNSTGGDWLSVSLGSGCCYATPDAITVSAHPSITLAAGTYSAEIIVKAQYGGESMVIPVTLTIAPKTVAFFDTLPGGLSFASVPTSNQLASQVLSIRNAGAGTLDWTLATSTADGAAWLSVSATSGTAPSTVSVAVKPVNLPGQGLTVGIFSGQIVLQTGTDRVTVPVTVMINASVYEQLYPVNFSKSYQGANPSSKSITVASTSANFNFSAAALSSTGGNWLGLNVTTGCCYPTPKTITLTANPDVSLAAGIYTAEVILTSQYGGQSMIVPVNLTVQGTGAAATPVFTPPGGSYSSSQSVVITAATTGSAIFYTTDGSTPTTSSHTYTAPIQVTASTTIKAISTAPGYVQSAVATAVYTLNGSGPATPTAMETITISEATSVATVYYTTNGSTPTTASTKYTSPITISASSVLKFIAVGTNNAASAVRTVTTTIQ